MQFNADALKDESTPVMPLAAIVFHGRGAQSSDIMTLHGIQKGKIQVGNYVDPQAVRAMLDDCMTDRASEGLQLIPDYILADTHKYLVWYRKAERRPFHYRHSANDHAKSWHSKVMYPALLFIANKQSRSLRILALKNNKRPSPDTQLYHAPLFNLNGSGGLCLGNAALPTRIEIDTIEQIESAFFDANGTHTNHGETLSNKALHTHKTLIQYWKHKAKHNEAVKISDLNPYRTLEDVLNEL